MVQCIYYMKMEELAAKWIAETDRIIYLVQHEFIHLDEKHFHYKVHVSRCSISQIILHLLSTNQSLFDCIERVMPVAKSIGYQQEYKPGYLVKYLFSRMSINKCRPDKKIDQYTDMREQSAENLFPKIIDQQMRIKELVTLCKSLDINRRVVPFCLFGLVTLSIAETFDYLIFYQKSQFRMARHILMLQQI